jgi:very-short-patch-repair endonuclease
MPEEGGKQGRDGAIARLAAHQHGVVSVQQLYAAGLSSSAIGDRVNAGRLHRVHRGVYAIGHPHLSDRGRWLAAVLASGKGAVLSHRSAGELWGILGHRPRRFSEAGGSSRTVDVTIPGGSGRKGRMGISLHRSSTLTAADCARRDGIPVTNPARTLADLHLSFPRQVFDRALREAEFLNVPIGRQTDHTRSELEARFLSLLRRHRLPQPEVNVRIDRFVVDFLWRSERLVVELDGWESHSGRLAFEEDRARDARLKLLGFEVVRFTCRQIQEERRSVVRTIRALLSAGSVWGRT